MVILYCVCLWWFCVDLVFRIGESRRSTARRELKILFRVVLVMFWILCRIYLLLCLCDYCSFFWMFFLLLFCCWMDILCLLTRFVSCRFSLAFARLFIYGFCLWMCLCLWFDLRIWVLCLSVLWFDCCIWCMVGWLVCFCLWVLVFFLWIMILCWCSLCWCNLCWCICRVCVWVCWGCELVSIWV